MTVEARGDSGAAPQLAPPTAWGATAMLLGVATALGHALGYAFSLVMSRALGPADFGALGALLGLAVVATVPATALQTQVARFCAVTPTHSVQRHGYRLSWSIGLAVAVLITVLAVPFTAVFRLDGPLSVVFLAAGLLPVSVIAARQGVLLGRGAFGLLALTTVLVPALRLAGGAIAAAADVRVAGALGLQALATWIALAVVVLLVPTLDRSGGDDDGTRRARPTLRGVLSAGVSLLGLFVLANLDVLLARALLSDHDSGLYVVGALGTKVVFWGSHFVALLVFPRVANGSGAERLVLRAGLVVMAVGGALAALSIPVAEPALDILVGSAYLQAAPVVPWFVILGTLLALVQLNTYAAVASQRHRAFSVLLWATVVAQGAIVGVAAHNSIRQIVLVCIVCTGMLAVASAALARMARP